MEDLVQGVCIGGLPAREAVTVWTKPQPHLKPKLMCWDWFQLKIHISGTQRGIDPNCTGKTKAALPSTAWLVYHWTYSSETRPELSQCKPHHHWIQQATKFYFAFKTLFQSNPAVKKEFLRALSIHRYLEKHTDTTKLTNTSQPSFGDPTPRTAEPSTF